MSRGLLILSCVAFGMFAIAEFSTNRLIYEFLIQLFLCLDDFTFWKLSRWRIEQFSATKMHFSFNLFA